MNEYVEVTLTFENSATWDFEIPPLMRHAGPRDLSNIVTDQISIRVGNKPLAYNLRQLYKLSGQELPPSMQIFVSYDIWLICHTIGVIKTGGYDSISQLGFRVDYQEEDVTVIDVLPKTEFYSLMDGRITFAADVGIDGQLSAPLPDLPLMSNIYKLGATGQLKIAADSHVAARMSFNFLSSVVQSIGIGSSYTEWVINRKEKPLYGDDIPLVQVILVPEGKEVMEFKAQVYANIPVFNLIPSRRRGNWMPFKIDLTN